MSEKLENLAGYLLEEGHACDEPDAMAKAVRLRLALEAAHASGDESDEDQ